MRSAGGFDTLGTDTRPRRARGVETAHKMLEAGRGNRRPPSARFAAGGDLSHADGRDRSSSIRWEIFVEPVAQYVTPDADKNGDPRDEMIGCFRRPQDYGPPACALSWPRRRSAVWGENNRNELAAATPNRR